MVAAILLQAEAEAMQIEMGIDLEIMQAEQAAELEVRVSITFEHDLLFSTIVLWQKAPSIYMKKAMEKENQLELEKKETLSSIEADKFKRIVDCIGSETLEAIARAGCVNN